MLTREPLIDHITGILSKLESYLKLKSAQNLNDSAVLVEDVCKGLLNRLYGYNLTNLNVEKPNAPAVDLVDCNRRLAVQVTVNDTTEKIRKTHRSASEHNLGDDFDRIILLFLVNKAPAEPAPSGNFAPCTHPEIDVRDISTILADIRALDVATMAALAELLDEEICNPAKPWNRDVNLRPANMGYGGGPHLVPSVNISTSKLYPTVLRILLENRGVRTAKGIRLTICHSETHTVSGAASDNWWKDIGCGRLNPRQLESIKTINPGESVDVLPIPFSEQPKEEISIYMRITGEDMAVIEWHAVLSTSDIGCGVAPFFSTGQIQNCLFLEETPTEAIFDNETKHSQAAREILEMLNQAGPLVEPALHVIQQPLPGNPTQTGFFIGESDASGGAACGMKSQFLTAAILELQALGYLHESAKGPGTLVYEFVQNQA